MSPKDLRHYLVVYRVKEGRAEVVEYAYDEYEEALDAYKRTETVHQDESDVEVVLLSADSRESLMATHGRFFDESRRHVDDYITERLDELLDDAERTLV
jgi:hypothetical protein